MLKLVENHNKRKKLHFVMKESKIFQVAQHGGSAATVVAKNVKSISKQNALEQLADRWGKIFCMTDM